jgi:hypothetical protein
MQQYKIISFTYAIYSFLYSNENLERSQLNTSLSDLFVLNFASRIPPPSPHKVKTSGRGFKDHAWGHKKL